MLSEFNRAVLERVTSKRPFATATIIRVLGSASAKPGSKAVIDERGHNVFGWVGGGCAESLVCEEALMALEDRQTRIIDVDLDDEVLGVGMPCGGHMEVYIEPHFPAKPLFIAGHNRLAQHLAMVGHLAGFAVTVHAPQARAENFPTAERVLNGDWHHMALPPDSFAVVATEHEGHAPALRKVLESDPAYCALVANRQVSQGTFKQLRAGEIDESLLTRIRTPAGLDLGCKTLEEVSLSIMAEILACERQQSAYPLRMIKGGHAGMAQNRPAPDADPTVPDLLIVGQGRIAEELARFGVMLRWNVTVNGAGEPGGNFPESVRMVTGDLDFSQMKVNPNSYVVIATLHKGDHLSMQRALAGGAPYIGLIASQKRSALVLEYLNEKGIDAASLDNVFAPAGLDLGCANPLEIALSVMSEMVGVYRGGTCRPLSELETIPSSGKPDACRQMFE